MTAEWLKEVAERSRNRLKALPVEYLGPGARIFFGIHYEKCEVCGGQGQILIDPREKAS